MATPARPSTPTVVLLTGTLQCGGSERQLADMANYWAARGFRVTLATWSGRRIEDFYELAPAIRRVHLDAGDHGKIGGNLARIAKLRRILRDYRPDALLSFLTRSNVPAILACHGQPVRVVISERVQPAHETGLQLEWRLLRRLVYRRADALVCQTHATANWIRRHWRQRSVVIPNALRPLPKPPERRESLILCVGRLVRQKGFDLLLLAYARIMSRFPGWHIAFAGNGPERGALDAMCRELRIEDRITYLGHVQDVEIWMGRAALVVQPSRFEGFPNAVLEAMGMGAAVISADCPAGPAELIEDGVNGRLVPVEDVDALASVMEELMSQPDLRVRLGQRALEVRDRFHQDKVMAQWEAILLPR